MDCKKKKIVLFGALVFVFLCLTVVCVVLAVHRKKEAEAEYYWYEVMDMPEKPYPYVSFCAEVTAVLGENLVEVNGLEINESVNLEGLFLVGTEDALIKRESVGMLKTEDLKVGDILFIQFSGTVKNSSPAKINAELIYYLGDKESFAAIGAEEETE